MTSNAVLGDVIELQRGFDLTESERRPGNVPVVGSAGVHGYHDSPRVSGPGVTMGRSGASFGRVTFVKMDFWPHNTTLFVKDFKGNRPRWVAYLLESLDFSNLNSGSAQQSLNRNYVYGMRVWLPSLAEQARIAGILSAYDDLIENCEQRIRVLEEMARSLYREWFVDFRYPGHDCGVRSGLPSGWQSLDLRELADVNAVKVDTKNPPARIGYIDIASVSPGKIDAISPFAFDEAPGRARRLVRHGDTLWSCVRPNRRSHALVVHPEPHTIASTGFAVLSPRGVPASYVYLATTTEEFVGYLEKRATGAAYPAVTGRDFEEAPVLLPRSDVLKRFGMVADAWSEASAGLAKRIKNLRTTRDLLLPRLLSGQLSVDDAA